LPGSFVAF